MLRVELRAAKIPWIGAIAWHYWFLILRDDRCDRWEVWQTAGYRMLDAQNRPDLNQTDLNRGTWGHLYRNLMAAEAGVGNGPSWSVSHWQGAEAIDLAQIIEATPQTYPHNDRYCFWPGPNSNTYVQWVLDTAQVLYGHPGITLSWQGWGSRF